eukprot:TRINITY_DN5188_c0_g1_i2.p1 TRINITY_DN5188_c0_g1~~TRINITY_DN5188_c0_g1_i2.p1  ORF type:complete len:193 (+),score=16.14 TRINITY_DN5188_c0_g1_i2:40-618(+)
MPTLKGCRYMLSVPDTPVETQLAGLEVVISNQLNMIAQLQHTVQTLEESALDDAETIQTLNADNARLRAANTTMQAELNIQRATTAALQHQLTNVQADLNIQRATNAELQHQLTNVQADLNIQRATNAELQHQLTNDKRRSGNNRRFSKVCRLPSRSSELSTRRSKPPSRSSELSTRRCKPPSRTNGPLTGS